MNAALVGFLQETVAPIIPHVSVPFWNLGTILAIIVQSAILVRWATRLEARVESEREKTADVAARYDARITVLERNGSPAVRTLGQYLEQEQVELKRILEDLAENQKAIEALSVRLARVETVCAMHHNDQRGR